jgi:hypothetical protein
METFHWMLISNQVRTEQVCLELFLGQMVVGAQVDEVSDRVVQVIHLGSFVSDLGDFFRTFSRPNKSEFEIGRLNFPVAKIGLELTRDVPICESEETNSFFN